MDASKGVGMKKDVGTYEAALLAALRRINERLEEAEARVRGARGGDPAPSRAPGAPLVKDDGEKEGPERRLHLGANRLRSVERDADWL